MPVDTEKDKFNYSIDLDSDQIDISYSVEDLNTMLKSSMTQYTYTTNTTGGAAGSSNYGNITINTGAGANGTWGTTSPYIYTTNNAGLHVTSDAEFEGDIKWKGRSLGKLLEDIENRLAILVPDPEKLEHFEALKKAYNHYKMLEALCELPKKEEK